MARILRRFFADGGDVITVGIFQHACAMFVIPANAGIQFEYWRAKHTKTLCRVLRTSFFTGFRRSPE